MSKTSKIETRIENSPFLNFDEPAIAKLANIFARMDVCLLVDCEFGVLNGDPNKAAGQREDDETGQGVVTDVCWKRLVRDAMLALIANGYSPADVKVDEVGKLAHKMFVAHRGVLNENIDAVYEAKDVKGFQPVEQKVPKGLLDVFIVDDEPVELPDELTLANGDKGWELKFTGNLNGDGRAAAKAAVETTLGKGAGGFVEKLMKKSKIKIKTIDDKTYADLLSELCRMFIDVRTFGAVATTGKGIGNVRGPWQFAYGRSIDVLEPRQDTISRMAITRSEDKLKKRGDYGEKQPVPYALYRTSASFSPGLAARSHFSVEDQKLFFNALAKITDFCQSSMRGVCGIVGVYVFVHNHALGNAPAHELQDRIRIAKKPGIEHPRKAADYQIAVDGDDLPEGVTLVRLYERKMPKVIAAVGDEVTNGVGVH